jgi:hypothetical protein
MHCVVSVRDAHEAVVVTLQARFVARECGVIVFSVACMYACMDVGSCNHVRKWIVVLLLVLLVGPHAFPTSFCWTRIFS